MSSQATTKDADQFTWGSEENRQEAKELLDRYKRGALRAAGRGLGVAGPSRQHSPSTAKSLTRAKRIVGHFINEPAKKIPVMTTCDVLVVGGGPSGLSAAIGAARAGADVVLLERYGCFGGVITTVGMETVGWYRYEGTVDCEGVGREMERLAESMGGTIKFPYNDSPCLDADFFKIVADKLVQDNGIRPVLHCMATEAIVENGIIKGVITESKSGRQAVLAGAVIDCTGDADVAYLAGAPFKREEKHRMQGCTTVFNVAGVDKAKFTKSVTDNPSTYGDWVKGWDQETTGKEDHLASPYLNEQLQGARDSGIIPEGVIVTGSWSALSDAGEATNLNIVHMKGYDCTNVHDLTKAEMEGRHNTMYALQALKTSLDGFEKAKLRNFGMTLGVRDTRKIIGRHNLTGDECAGEARFEDSIGIFPEFLDGYSILILPTTGRYFQVPYGCMVPLGVDNLLVAGRAVAGDKMSHAATRNMMCCTVTGQGAGVAAAVAVQQGTTTANVDIRLVQDALKAQNARVF